MKIWYLNHPLLCPGTDTWFSGFLSNGAVYLGDDASGSLLSVQPDGSFQSRPNNAKGEWETCTPAATLNVLQYVVNGVPFSVPYRAR